MNEVNNKNNINKLISNCNLLITEREAFVLNKYGINYNNCPNMKSLLFLIESYLNTYELSDKEYDEIDVVARDISDRNYYQFTNK